MRLYQFHFFSARGVTPMMDLGLHEDDDQARDAAAFLLGEHRSAAGVEIYDVDRLVARLDQQVDARVARA